MRRKIFSIWSVLLVLVVSIAVLGPGCGPTGEGESTIKVEATLCGVPWQGFVDFTVEDGPEEDIDGLAVPATVSGLSSGVWTCSVDSPPSGAYLKDITPDPTQTVYGDDTITFTLNFELEQDASIEFLTWTINGVPIEELEYGVEWWYEEGYYYAFVTWCDVIDVHYAQHVDGCEGREVTLNETSELVIHYEWSEEFPHPEAVWAHVLNDWCAVNKTPEPEKLDQMTSLDGDPIPHCETFPLPLCHNVTLDVVTVWQLEKCTNYTKTINWLHIGESEPPSCALFDLLIPYAYYGFTLYPSASVTLVDDVDVNPGNNHAYGFPLRLTASGG